MTNDLERSIAEDNCGENRSTKAYKPFILIHNEVFDTRIEARIREENLKSGIGKEPLKLL